MKQIYILPFDHRGSFMKTIVKAQSPPTDDDVAKAKEYKQIIFEAFKKSVAGGVPKENAGILVDEWLGKEILAEANSEGYITSTPFEKSGQEEFDFDREDWQQQLEELKPTYAKVLVRYNPDNDAEMNARQEKRLAELGAYLKDKESQYLFELLVPATEQQLADAGSKDAYEQQVRPKLMVQTIANMHAAGVEPQVWKLEGLDSTESMQEVADEATKDGREAGIIILGRGESAQKAEEWLKAGAKVDAAVGFAVGRTIFQQPLLDLADGNISRDEAVNKISENYSFFVNVWEDAKGA